MWLALMPTGPCGTGYWVNVAHPEGRTTKVTTRFPVHRPNQFRPAWGIKGYRRVMVDGWLLSIQRRAHDARLSELETATPTEAIIEPTLGDGDHDRFAHFARKADITKSAVTGRPIVALCGKVWVPGRNPDRYPVCPTCKEIYQRKKAKETGG